MKRCVGSTQETPLIDIDDAALHPIRLGDRITFVSSQSNLSTENASLLCLCKK